MTPQETFVTRLRRYRERARISLDEISAETRVKRELLDALERNDLSGWPRGLYARAWIRSYATALGLDPAETVDEFCRLFPNGDRRTRVTIEEIAGIIASPSTYSEAGPDHPRRRATDPPIPPATWRSVLADLTRTRGRGAGDLFEEVARTLRLRRS